ncbi:MAG: hypothetical protein U1F52_10895 [Burkholderiales bacterium]
MRYSLLAVAIAGAMTYHGAAMAGIDDSFDWVNDAATGKPKRVLKVYYNFGDADKLGNLTMKAIMDEAIANWNGAKADTGWEFVTGGTAASHDIEIKVGDIDAKVGGARTSGFPDAGAKDRTVSKLSITFDPTPKEGFEWGANDDAKKNAVSNAKHELSHTLRLDHQGGTRSESKKLKDPQGDVTKGDDILTVSKDDKDEAKKASLAAIKVAVGPVGPGQDYARSVPAHALETPGHWPTPEISMFVPGSAVSANTTITFSRTSLYSMPRPWDVAGNAERMIKGVHIDVTGGGGPPALGSDLFLLVIPYEDGLEGEGSLLELGDREYTRLREDTLGLYFYDSLSRVWRPVNATSFGGFLSVDTVNDRVQVGLPTVTLAELGTADSTGYSVFLSLGAQPVPEPKIWLSLASGLLVLGAFARRAVR